jgi:hypothetical protein
MARRIIIGEILNLIKGLGGNPNKFMGTKSNITFLGKGPQESLFQGAIDIEGMVKSGFPIQKVISEAESAGGYVTAGKLNDLQLQRLKDNLLQLKQAYKPDQVPNITDLGTGTGDLTKGGLETLRRGGDPTKYKQGDAITSENFGATGFAPSEASLMTRLSERMNKLKGMSDEIGTIGKSDVNVAQILETEGHNIPQMRSAARETLLDLMKVEDGVPISEIDIKFITEGGGGQAGDPINLMVKYFGKNVTENLPKDATKENITRFTDFIMKAKDSQGRGVRDPFFDRESIKFTEFASGGRAGFRLGGFGGKFSKAQVLIARLKNTIKGSNDKYVQETFPNFIKEIEANPKLAENENVWRALGGDLPKDQRLVVHGDDTVDFFTQTKFGPHNIENITRFIEKYPFLSREEAMRILKMEPEDRILEITRLETIRNRTKNASGGLAKILEV